MTAAGLSRSALSGNGRDAQSSAFFSTPGIDALYSGVAIRTASAASMASRTRHLSRRASRLDVLVVTAGAPAGRPTRARTTPGGSSSPAARSKLAVVGPPAQAPCDAEDLSWTRPAPQREVDGDGHLVGQRVAAVGQRRVPVHAYFVRSTSASSCRWPRALPKASACGALHVPVAGPGCVMPLIVSSPDDGRPVVAQVERGRRSVISGWFWASKNSRPEHVGAELVRRDDRDRLDLGGTSRGAVGLAWR